MSVHVDDRARRWALAMLVVVVGLIAVTHPADAASPTAVSKCLDEASSEPGRSYESRLAGERLEITEYLPAGAYRSSVCRSTGALVESLTAEPHRLPNGKVTWLPHEKRTATPEGVRAVVADFGDFRLYEGDWRAAVTEARRSVRPPASPSRVTTPRLPTASDAASPVRRGDPNRLELKVGREPEQPSAQRMLDPRCGYGGYSFAYYHKTSALHEINLAMISVEHHPAFIENINQGFNTWQYTYNVCGFAPVNGVSAATYAYSLTPSGINDGIEIVDAGPLTSGSCAGAIACAYIWPDLKHDVRLSTAFPYCVGWCAGHYDIWSVVSHEAGHVYGFGHDGSAGMVMYPYINPNDAGNRYLWWGDYQGLSSQY